MRKTCRASAARVRIPLLPQTWLAPLRKNCRPTATRRNGRYRPLPGRFASGVGDPGLCTGPGAGQPPGWCRPRPRSKAAVDRGFRRIGARFLFSSGPATGKPGPVPTTSRNTSCTSCRYRRDTGRFGRPPPGPTWFPVRVRTSS